MTKSLLKEKFISVTHDGVDLKISSIATDSNFVIYKTSRSIVEWSKSETLLERFKKFSGRKLFMYGQHNAWKADILPADIPRAEIPDAGHFMLKEKPRECYAVIEDFFKSKQ